MLDCLGLILILNPAFYCSDFFEIASPTINIFSKNAYHLTLLVIVFFSNFHQPAMLTPSRSLLQLRLPALFTVLTI